MSYLKFKNIRISFSEQFPKLLQEYIKDDSDFSEIQSIISSIPPYKFLTFYSRTAISDSANGSIDKPQTKHPTTTIASHVLLSQLALKVDKLNELLEEGYQLVFPKNFNLFQSATINVVKDEEDFKILGINSQTSLIINKNNIKEYSEKIETFIGLSHYFNPFINYNFQDTPLMRNMAKDDYEFFSNYLPLLTNSLSDSFFYNNPVHSTTSFNKQYSLFDLIETQNIEIHFLGSIQKLPFTFNLKQQLEQQLKNLNNNNKKFISTCFIDSSVPNKIKNFSNDLDIVFNSLSESIGQEKTQLYFKEAIPTLNHQSLQNLLNANLSLKFRILIEQQLGKYVVEDILKNENPLTTAFDKEHALLKTHEYIHDNNIDISKFKTKEYLENDFNIEVFFSVGLDVFYKCDSFYVCSLFDDKENKFKYLGKNFCITNEPSKSGHLLGIGIPKDFNKLTSLYIFNRIAEEFKNIDGIKFQNSKYSKQIFEQVDREINLTLQTNFLNKPSSYSQKPKI